MEQKTFNRNLSCVLNKDEILTYSKQLSREISTKVADENGKAEVMAEFTAKIKRHESAITEISGKINNGYEYRQVPCYWKYYWGTNKKELIRTDTGQIAETDVISDHERQMELDYQKGKGKKEAKKKGAK